MGWSQAAEAETSGVEPQELFFLVQAFLSSVCDSDKHQTEQTLKQTLMDTDWNKPAVGFAENGKEITKKAAGRMHYKTTYKMAVSKAPATQT